MKTTFLMLKKYYIKSFTIIFLLCFLNNPLRADWSDFADSLKKNIDQDTLNMLKKGAASLNENKDAFIDVGLEKERNLGKGMSSQLLGAVPLVKNQSLQRYVNKIGFWLAIHTERANLDWRFGVLEDETLNAYAAPGGFIFITKGLFQLLENEAELASVLAHEIAHVVVKHHLEDIKEKARANLIKDIGTTTITELSDSKWDMYSSKFIEEGVDVWESGLNRTDEFESDLLGMKITEQAGYNPLALYSVIHKLSLINPASPSYTLMHSTHPAPWDRLKYLQENISSDYNDYEGLILETERFDQFKSMHGSS